MSFEKPVTSKLMDIMIPVTKPLWYQSHLPSQSERHDNATSHYTFLSPT